MIEKLPRLLKNKIQEEYKMSMIRKGNSLPSGENIIVVNYFEKTVSYMYIYIN